MMANFWLLLWQVLLIAVVYGFPDGINNNGPTSRISRQIQILASSIRNRYPAISHGKLDLWELLQIMAVCGLFPGFWYLNSRRKESKLLSWNTAKPSDKEKCDANIRKSVDINDAEVVDPGLLKKHSEFRTFTTKTFKYGPLRIFFRRHPQAEKLPTTPAPLPLLVFIHGLGGSSYQFHSLLTSMVNLASCLSIDMPGCGLSSFAPTSWDAYKTENLVDLLEVIIEEYREKEARQQVVLIGHSMGCSLAALLASKTSLHSHNIAEHVVGLIGICPKADPPTEDQVATFRKLLWVPNVLFDVFRRWDRRGGINSPSVARFVGADANDETKKLQERFNSQSRTAVWRRMAAGSLPVYENGIPKGGLPGRDVWTGLECPVFLVAGESDHITQPAELEKIANFLGKSHPAQLELNEGSDPIIAAAAPATVFSDTKSEKRIDRQIETMRPENFDADSDTLQEAYMEPSTPNEELSIIPPQASKPKRVLKTTILPSPASHALLYMPSTVRILAGLISDFLCSQVSPRLSLGWQLQFLSTAGKWDVKNLAKWQAVTPVSHPIAGIFRAMKTLREVDESHCPEIFVRDWGSQVKDIVDISHESPVYDPKGLEDGGIRYHKFPTVSKIPPTGEEVTMFVSLIDRLREEQKTRAVEENWGDERYIGVHCHYGKNRTGYFICSYLIERLGYTVQGAIDEFAEKRPFGIRHAHFLDQLFVRYCVGLKRAPTL